MFSKQQCNPDLQNAGQAKGRNPGPKTRALKMVNRARAVQVVLLLVQITSRSPNFLENISFARNWDIKLQIAGRKPACSICLGCLAQPKQNKKPLQFPLRETERAKRGLLVLWTWPLGIWVVLPLQQLLHLICNSQTAIACPTLCATLLVQSLSCIVTNHV